MNIPSIAKEEQTQEEVTEQVTETQEQTTEQVTQEPETTQEPEVKQQSVEGAFTDADRIPANWNINPTEDGIEAFNSNTGSRFVGTISDFNAKLRG
jgi:hypothetical protein